MPVKKLQLPPISEQNEFDVPNPATAPGFAGDMPLPVGKVMKPVRYTDAEKAVLERLGVKEGEAIPVDLADRLGSIGEKMTQEALAAPVIENRPPLKIPDPVSIDSLDETHQARIRQALQEAEAISGKVEDGSNDSIKPDRIVDIKNDLKEVPDDVGETEKPLAGGDISFSQAFCPHCGWDQSHKDIEDPDDDTKLWYLQAILGNIPFEKTYVLMGGAIELTIRELAQSQVDWVFSQTGQEIKAQKDTTIDQFVELVRRYRLCLQLKSVKIGETFFEIPGDEEKPRLPELFKLITEQVFNSASLVNLALRKTDEFNRLASKLEASADRENFWPAA